METTTRRDGGFSLVELLLVVALLGTTIGVMYSALQVLTISASTSTEESAAAQDLSYSMELLSKTLMGSQVLYANDTQIVVLSQVGGGTWQVSSIAATAGPTPRGGLIWRRWSSDASGTVPVGASYTRWVMSDRNANQSNSIALFSYYSATNTVLTQKSTTADARATAVVGALPVGYAPTDIKRIRLHIATTFNAGIRDDFRDIALR